MYYIKMSKNYYKDELLADVIWKCESVNEQVDYWVGSFIFRFGE